MNVTKQEIQTEISALKALKAPTVHTKELIGLSIEELEFGVDQTSGEWDEMRQDEQDIVHFTQLWKNGNSHIRPSERLK